MGIGASETAFNSIGRTAMGHKIILDGPDYEEREVIDVDEDCMQCGKKKENRFLDHCDACYYSRNHDYSYAGLGY